MDPIPADECRTLEAIIKDDLQRAKILSVSVYVDEDGSIEVEELALRIYGGREVVLATGDAEQGTCDRPGDQPGRRLAGHDRRGRLLRGAGRVDRGAVAPRAARAVGSRVSRRPSSGAG